MSLLFIIKAIILTKNIYYYYLFPNLFSFNTKTLPFLYNYFLHKTEKPSSKGILSVFHIFLFKLLGGEIYLAVLWYTFVDFILHIHLILHFCVPRLKFLEPKWSQISIAIIIAFNLL